MGDARLLNRAAVLYVSAVLASAVVVGTGLIPQWGRWYSDHLPCRWQDEAMLRGHLSISEPPAALGWELAWGTGGVHQIWGLAIPIWRLPFEGLARLARVPAFPDRFAFGILLTIAIYALIR